MIRYTNKHKTTVGLFLASMSIFIWGITFVCTKALLHDFSALEILVIRFIAAYVGLWLLHPHVLHIKNRKHEILFAAAGLCGVTVYQFLENMAISYTSASNVSIIVSICPIFTAIISQIFLKEKHISARFLFGFIIAISGIILVSFNGTVILRMNPIGDFLAFSASALWGFYSLFVSKLNLLGYRAIPATRRIFFYALLFMIPFVFAGIFFPQFKDDPNMYINTAVAVNAVRFSHPINWINLLFLGFCASAFCFAAWSIACNFLGTVRATIGLYLIPVVTTVFAYFVLGEPITPMGMAGTALTITGLFISEWKKVGGKNEGNY